jgi:hypothetical protein
LLAVMGGAGLLLGLALAAAGNVGGDLGQMLTGYGLLVLGAATYLLLGLGVKVLLDRRNRPRPAGSPVRIGLERRA